MARPAASLDLPAPRRLLAGGLRESLNTAQGLSALTFLTCGVFFLARLLRLGGDVTRFVIASARIIPPCAGASVGLSVLTSSIGYDGQFSYVLALNPFVPVPTLSGAHFDVPVYRFQRILYPLLVWVLSLGGHPALVPALLVIVNLAAIIGVGAL